MVWYAAVSMCGSISSLLLNFTSRPTTTHSAFLALLGSKPTAAEAAAAEDEEARPRAPPLLPLLVDLRVCVCLECVGFSIVGVRETINAGAF